MVVDIAIVHKGSRDPDGGFCSVQILEVLVGEHVREAQALADKEGRKPGESVGVYRRAIVIPDP